MREFADRGLWVVADPVLARRGHAAAMVDDELTERERTAAILLAYGHTNRDVARELRVSMRTAEGERARVMRKLGFDRRSQLVRWAIERDLLQ